MSKKGRGTMWFFLTSIMYIVVVLFHSNSFFTAIGWLDPRYVLLPPQHPSSTIPQPVENKIAIHFVTCFSQNMNTVCQYLKQENITQWARVQQLAGGDLMYASELFIQAEDHRDATYVQVCIDIEASVSKLTQKFFLV